MNYGIKKSLQSNINTHVYLFISTYQNHSQTPLDAETKSKLLSGEGLRQAVQDQEMKQLVGLCTYIFINAFVIFTCIFRLIIYADAFSLIYGIHTISTMIA